MRRYSAGRRDKPGGSRQVPKSGARRGDSQGQGGPGGTGDGKPPEARSRTHRDAALPGSAKRRLTAPGQQHPKRTTASAGLRGAAAASPSAGAQRRGQAARPTGLPGAGGGRWAHAATFLPGRGAASPPSPAAPLYRDTAALPPRGALPRTAAWRPPACPPARRGSQAAAAASLPGAGPPRPAPPDRASRAAPAPPGLGRGTRPKGRARAGRCRPARAGGGAEERHREGGGAARTGSLPRTGRPVVPAVEPPASECARYG